MDSYLTIVMTIMPGWTAPCHCAADVFFESDFSRGGMVGDHPYASGDHYLGIFEWHGYHVYVLCGAAHWTNMTPTSPNVTISFWSLAIRLKATTG